MSMQPRLVEVRRNVLKHNDVLAAALRDRFDMVRVQYNVGRFLAAVLASERISFENLKAEPF